VDWSWLNFLIGAVGATAPEVVRLYRIVTVAPSDPLPMFDKKYFLISLLLVALGGFLAVI